MDHLPDLKTLGLIGGVLALLGVASAVLRALKNREASGLDTAMVETFRQRVRAWWVLFSVLAAALIIPGRLVITVVLFGLIAFWALREFITLTPTRPGDHRALFWVFFLLTPLQFVLVGVGAYEVYSILIPVYAFLFVLARVAMAGDSKRFLERCAKIQAGLLICVYCLSHAPALVTTLHTPEDDWDPAALLFFFVLIVQLSDALQYAWSQIPSKHVIVPTINPGKTWEGLIGGTASVTLIGAALWWATPFSQFWIAAAMSTVISLTGFAGSLTLSAIKRDRGVADYGTLVEGHGGVLDRIDSLCFAAPVFFHLTRLCL
ncbi:MAG: phosphatidate cytidylyltransferase [Candidatus Nealsonbacteria bacterium]|nr:phosphatidate cytidylyltransferase [Candidatus Nealsonbacteria bacterium]